MNGYDSIHSQGLQEIRRIIDADAFAQGQGSLETSDALTPYMDYIQAHISLGRPLRIGIDAGNGTGGVHGPAGSKGSGMRGSRSLL